VKYCNELCLFVSLFVCSYNLKTTRLNFTEFFMHVAMVRSSSDGVVICYVLPVLQMLCFHTMGPMGRIKRNVMFRLSSPGGGTNWT